VTKEVTVLDYGAGNLRSVVRALEHAGARAHLTSDVAEARRARRLLLPGQGHFGQCMQRLERSGLADVVREHVAGGRPFLGICVGMQLLYEGSDEAPGVAGFGMLHGRVARLPTDRPLPHVGWNAVRFTGRARETALLAGLKGDQPTFFYHVHTFAALEPGSPETLGVCEYDAAFASIAGRENVWGVQFHPEKSQEAGLRILANFAALDG
jgi:imidazole glycerol-phosphate synthase subunit HisH